MFRSALAAALRHLARSRFYAVISILGLAIGLAAALLAVLVVRNQTSQDRFIRGYERIYLATTAVTPPGRATVYLPSVNSFVGPQLQSEFSSIEAVTRLSAEDVRLERGQVSAVERIYWADPNAFDLLPLPAVTGDLAAALRRPDGIVVSRSIARKYFGSDQPLGQTLLLDGKVSFTITAVIEDVPLNATHLGTGIFLSALSPRSSLSEADRNPANVPGSPVGFGTNTYLRLAPAASLQRLQDAMPTAVGRLFSPPPQGWKIALRILRLDRLNSDPGLNPGTRGKLLMTLVTGFGILVIACVNFTNLLTARLQRRAPEVGVRKIAGASRGVLMVQFLGESVAYVTVAMLIGVALTEMLLPHANAALNISIEFRYWREPGMTAAIMLSTILFGAVAGVWPAFVMSGFRPLLVLKGGLPPSAGTGMLRQGLVMLQFAILVGLLIAAGVVHQQRLYATRDAIQIDTDQMLLIRAPCKSFVTELARLPGVVGVACSDQGITGSFSVMTLKARDGIEQLVFQSQISPQLFGLYRVRPVAGKLGDGSGGTHYVLNETAVRRLGYTDPAQIVGTVLPTDMPGAKGPSERIVIGVVPDFSLTSVERKIEAMAYVVNSGDPGFNLINVRLSGKRVPETLASIDDLWKQSGERDPISRIFLEDHIQRLYTAMLREAQLFAGFSALAVVLACLGLLGLAASVAERRTKEIGIRKALGATTGDVLRLLLWRFSKPVVLANLIALPAAGWAMQRWLNGFAYHIDLPLWLFPATGLATVLIALATVSAHAMRVARAKPVTALRYE